MNWFKLIYVVIIVTVYIPMVFLGANVFFSEFTGQNAYYHDFDDCYGKYPYPTDVPTLDEAARLKMTEAQRKCQVQSRLAQERFESDKLAYDGMKYIFITLFNLAVLLLAVLLPQLRDSAAMGLFFGSVLSTFGATIRYFDTRSKIGFVILVITFFVMLFFINRKKDTFF